MSPTRRVMRSEENGMRNYVILLTVFLAVGCHILPPSGGVCVEAPAGATTSAPAHNVGAERRPHEAPRCDTDWDLAVGACEAWVMDGGLALDETPEGANGVECVAQPSPGCAAAGGVELSGPGGRYCARWVTYSSVRQPGCVDGVRE